MPFDAEDIAQFSDTDMPGYAQATIGAALVGGRFRQYADDVLNVVAGTRQTFSAATDQLADVTVGTAVEINATAYTVAEIQPDGTGLTRLMLKS